MSFSREGKRRRGVDRRKEGRWKGKKMVRKGKQIMEYVGKTGEGRGSRVEEQGRGIRAGERWKSLGRKKCLVVGHETLPNTHPRVSCWRDVGL